MRRINDKTARRLLEYVVNKYLDSGKAWPHDYWKTKERYSINLYTDYGENQIAVIHYNNRQIEHIV